MRTLPGGLAGAFTYAEAARAGWTCTTLAGAVRAGRLLHPFHGVYLPPPASPLSRAAAVALASGGVASHVTAARVHALWILDEGDWATVDPKLHRLSRPGLRLVRETLPSREVTRLAGVPVTAPARTVVDLCRRASRLQGVCAIESALRAGLLPPAWRRRLRAHPDRRVRERAALADPASESPLETAVRLLLVDAGIRVTPQVQLRSPAGDVLARLDLVVTGTRVAIECDGQGPHQLPEALFRDRQRANALAARWQVLRFTWADLRREGLVVATVRATLAAGRKRGNPRRRTA